MKKIIFAFSALALIGAFVFSCKKPEPEKVVLNAPVISAEMSGDAVSVSWDPVTNATGYKVEYKKATDAEFALAGSPTYGPFLVTGFDFGNVYEFRMKATCGDVESPYSNVVSVEVAKYLSKPIIEVAPGIGFLKVEWQAVEGAASYQLEYKLALASEYTVGYSGDELSCKLTGLESGVAYDVRVGVIAEGYAMSYSDVTTISTTAAPSTIIANADQFIAWLASISGLTTEVAALTADIDMTGKTITSAAGFFGELQGQGFAIKNLQSSVPIFAQNNGRIVDLTIDETCEFSAGSTTFGALVAEDGHGVYENVKNRAKVTYTASADVTKELVIGGIVGQSDGGTFKNCSNSGAVSIEAAGYSHLAVGLGGLAGYAEDAIFESCINRGPVSLKAKYGNPRSELCGRNYQNSGGGINVGGILGCGQDASADNYCIFTECQNESAGVISFNHTKIDGLAAEGQSGIVAVGGIVGRARGDVKKCKNWAEVNVSATSDSEGAELQNYVLEVGGIAGVGVWGLSFESCVNESNVNVVYDGRYGGNRIQGAVGGICGRENPDDDSVTDEDGVKHAGSYAHYCKVKGNVNVSGKGTACVGGIFGIGGIQIGNQVTNTASISFSGYKGSVGGLVGYVDGSPKNYTIRSSSCAAAIVGESYKGDNEAWFGVGGLMGRWGGAKTSNYPILASRDNTPCSFSGSVSSSSLSKCVGIVIGDIRGQNMDLVFGDKDFPIQATGTYARKELDQITINSENVSTYAWGRDQGANITMYVESPTAP